MSAPLHGLGGGTASFQSPTDSTEFLRGPRPNRWSKRYVWRLAVSDALAIAWAATGAHVVEVGTDNSPFAAHPYAEKYIALTVGLVVAWNLVLQYGGSRDAEVVGHGPDEYKRVIQGSFGMFGLLAICSYLFQADLPRTYVLVMLPAGLGSVLLTRFAWRRWLHARRDAGDFMSRVLVVGNVHTVRELLEALRHVPRAGYDVIGVCVRGGDSEHIGAQDVDGAPILGDLSDVTAVAERWGADTVAVTSTAAFGPSKVRALGWELERTDIDLVLAPALTNIAGPRIHTKPVAGLPLIHVDRPTYRGANKAVKKSFDSIGSVILLTLFTPVLLMIAIAVKMTSPGPIFFRQDRAGLNGKTFKMIKFRSMVVDAEARLADLRNAEHDAGNDVLFKMKDDPRVTKIGKILRRYSLDELPQLVNVLKGDMSLVGPRPPLQAEVDVYGEEAKLRLLVKPGMTGLWQVSGRSDLTWDDTVRLDVYYVENWSITSDLVILWKTLKAILASSGAY